jgi:hypothetical protein
MAIARVKRIVRTILHTLAVEFRHHRDFIRENATIGRDAYNQTKVELLARQRKAKTDA